MTGEKDSPGAVTAELITNQLQGALVNFHRGPDLAQAEALKLYAWSLTFAMAGLPASAQDTLGQLLDEVVNAFLMVPSNLPVGDQALAAMLRYLGKDDSTVTSFEQQTVSG